MKILFLSSSSGSQGGGELCLNLLGKALVARGHTVVLWASDHKRMDDLCKGFEEFGQVIRSNYKNTYDFFSRPLAHVGSLFSGGKLQEVFEGVGADVIHLNKQNLEDGLDLVADLGRMATPNLLFIHITQTAHSINARFGRFRDWIARLFLRRYRAPILTTTNRLAQLRDFLGSGVDFASIDNGVVVPEEERYARLREEGRRLLGLSDEEFLILGVGRIEWQKRPDRFREMAYLLMKAIPGSRVVWVGGGRLEGEWDAWAKEKGLGEEFRYIGWQEDVFPYLAAADINIHSAAFEGMPFSLLEAMAWRCPTVMMDELAKELDYFDEAVAIIAEEGSDSWVKRALDAEDRESVRQAAHCLVSKQFSVERMAEEYEAMYLRLIRERRAESEVIRQT